MKNKLKIEYTQIIIFILSLFIFILILLPIKYKYIWALIYPLVFLKINKYIFPLVLIISLILTPKLIYLKIPNNNEVMKGNNSKVATLLKNENISNYFNEKTNLIYARNICYFYYNDCEYKYIDFNYNSKVFFKINSVNYYFIEGNIIHINYDMRTKYKFNRYLSEKDWRDFTLFIPTDYKEQIVYNYSFFKESALKELISSGKNCELLLYGSQNGWKSYTDILIKTLENDESNQCINEIEKNTIEYRDLTIEEKNKDKIKLIKFLKNLQN